MVEGVHYLGLPPYVNFAGGHVFQPQRGYYQKFSDFFQEFLDKFNQDSLLRDPKDQIDAVVDSEIFSALAQDISEPDAVNIALKHEETTFNIFS